MASAILHRLGLGRIVPVAPALTLATIYTSLAYNYAVQARRTRDDVKVHTLRVQALSELRTVLLARDASRSDDQARDEEDEAELVRALVRLALEPAHVGYAEFSTLSSSARATASAGDSPLASLSSSRTGWSDVLFEGPNSYRSQHGQDDTKTTTLGMLSKAIGDAFKDFAVLGSGGGSGRRQGDAGTASDEDAAIESWLARVESADESRATTSNSSASRAQAQASTADAPPYQRVRADLSSPSTIIPPPPTSATTGGGSSAPTYPPYSARPRQDHAAPPTADTSRRRPAQPVSSKPILI